MEFGDHTPFLIIPILAAIGLIEAFIFSRVKRQEFPWGESLASIGVGAGQAIKNTFTRAAVFGAFMWLWQFRVFTAPTDTWWGIGLLFVAVEFFYYWHHRWGHEVRWLWATHSVHHSANRLNFLAAIRLGWTGEVSAAILMFAPLILLGFHPIAVFAMLGVNLLYQFWIHSEVIPRLGWIEGIINTASNHRVHHSANPIYLDTNYGGITVIFDRIFGTYQAELPEEPCRFGLVHPLTTNNPLRIAFNEWGALFRDVLRSRDARARFMSAFGPPGWSADGNGSTTADLRRRAGQ